MDRERKQNLSIPKKSGSFQEKGTKEELQVISEEPVKIANKKSLIKDQEITVHRINLSTLKTLLAIFITNELTLNKLSIYEKRNMIVNHKTLQQDLEKNVRAKDKTKQVSSGLQHNRSLLSFSILSSLFSARQREILFNECSTINHGQGILNWVSLIKIKESHVRQTSFLNSHAAFCDLAVQTATDILTHLNENCENFNKK